MDSGEEQSVAVFYNTSSNFVYSTKPEEKDADWTNNYLPHEISEIVNQEIILNETDVSSNENVNNIFFKVVSKDKFIDVYGEEACLTKFEVTNKSNYTLVNDESISFDFYFQINSDNDYEHVENVNFVNPHLNKTDPDFYEDSIEYFTVGMKSNLGGYLSSFDYGEHSSIVTSKKCKRIKKYILSLSCEVYTADKIWDANENEIDWKSDKKAYRTIQESLAPHPDHDKKKYGKIIFKRDTYC